jgi:copper chaperone CopZ
MHRRLKLAIVVTLLAALIGPSIQAANTPTTAIRVKDMHCEACAAKIRRGLFAVAGVVNVKTDVKTHVAVVMPQQSHQPSPRAMWEAVEKAGFQVVSLEGPGGMFTEKPQQ